ncbi:MULTISPECIES: hypothetical protein [unclassified Streptomyces]|uniref:hypothetical protein n=1 Tax=unclassified Streptomyces TaxID=2593676 RepID=UPI000DB946D2|nr:hypothetical protein [Streptomyces sp. PsTaAH-137]MYT74031.1 hypothetical protein [Streptomyces sp. SID8367]RAJ89447.1 hypothetical protein K377_01572 [Streptomyces sp. PsTaAH-137]
MKPHAEVEQVWPRDGRIRVTGRLLGLDGARERAWRLTLTRRSRTDHVLRCAAEMDGERFTSEFAVAELAAYDGSSDVEQWDLHLTDGTHKLRVGRKLDDIRGKKAIMIYPVQPVPGADFAVQPYFTVEDNLSLECRA